MNDMFEKLVKQTVGEPGSLEKELAAAQKERENADAKIRELNEKIENRKQAAIENECQMREIVIQYIPNKTGSVRIVKGAEPMLEGQPDNVVAMIEAAATVMEQHFDGLNKNILTVALLETLIKATEVGLLIGGVLH